MNGRTKKLTAASMLAALAAALLYVAAVLPTGRLALTAVAGLCTGLAVMRCGRGYALGAFAVSAGLGLLLSPIKGCALLYLIFLGWYPVAKSLIERLRGRVWQWAAKLCVFTAALAAVRIIGGALVSDTGLSALSGSRPAVLIWLAAEVVFVLYDLGLSRLITIYLRRFVKK